MILNRIPAYPPNWMPVVDIKDIAIAHVRAVERPAAANKRFVLSLKDTYLFRDMAEILHKSLTQSGYDFGIQRKEAPGESSKNTYNNQQSRDILGLEYKRSV